MTDELVLHRGIGKPTRCRSCKAEIVFAFHPTSQKDHPFQLDDAGVWVVENGTARHVGPAIAQAAQLELLAPAPAAQAQRYTSHFSTCPAAASWRAKK